MSELQPLAAGSTSRASLVRCLGRRLPMMAGLPSLAMWSSGPPAVMLRPWRMIDDGSATTYTITGLKTGVAYRVHIAGSERRWYAGATSPLRSDAAQRTVTPTTSVSSGTVRVSLAAWSIGPRWTSALVEGSQSRFVADTPVLGSGRSLCCLRNIQYSAQVRN